MHRPKLRERNNYRVQETSHIPVDCSGRSNSTVLTKRLESSNGALPI